MLHTNPENLSVAELPLSYVNMQADRDSSQQDAQLISRLYYLNQQNPGYYSEATDLTFSNTEIGKKARSSYSGTELSEIRQHLVQNGTLTVPVIEDNLKINGTEHKLALVGATDTAANHGDMSSMVYLRDQIQVASAFLEQFRHNPNKYQEEGGLGQRLLFSALHLMSTPSQLTRFANCIKLGNLAGQGDWPQISLQYNNLDGNLPNKWRNKQDSFQMLGHLVLEQIEIGCLSTTDLASQHKQFLASIVPFLAAVGFPRYENSGSWEEVATPRTSVMAIETALLHKIHQIQSSQGGLDFLERGFTDYRSHFSLSEQKNFWTVTKEMLENGLRELGRRLPYESADADPNSVRYREADAALAYLLMYNIPQLLAEEKIPIGTESKIMNAPEIENLILGQISTLLDEKMGGIKRYENDSYQRVNFHTHAVQVIIRAIKKKVQHDADLTNDEINLDVKQEMRNSLTREGREAAWNHPLSQIVSFAANRSLKESSRKNYQEAARYAQIGMDFLNHPLSRVTGQNQYHAVLDENGSYKIQKVPAYKMPECDVTYMFNDGESYRSFAVPSPHTPLNWAAAELGRATALLIEALQ